MGIIAPPQKESKPSGPAGGVLAGTYPNPGLSEFAVKEENIGEGQVSGAKMGNNSISPAKLQAKSVTAPKLGIFGQEAPAVQHAALPNPKILLEVEAWAKEVNEVLKSFGLTA